MKFPQFTDSFIRQHKVIKSSNGMLFVGLPGVGFASKLAVDHLVKQLKAQRIGTVYSPHFPNQVVATNKGNLKAFTLKFYYVKVKNKHVFFLKGDLQPLTVEGQYEVTAKALQFFKEAGGQNVYAMAGLVTHPGEKDRAIYASSTHKKQLKELKKTIGSKIHNNYVPIMGMAGLVPTLSPLYGLTGTCLLVETTGEPIDSVAASKLVEVVGKMIGKKIPIEQLKKKAEQAKANLEQLNKQQTQMQEQPAIPGAAPVLPKDSLRYIR